MKHHHFVNPVLLVTACGTGLFALVGLQGWSLLAWLLFAAIVIIPRLQAAPLADKPDLWVETENKARATLAQVAGGFILLAGAYSAWSQFQNQRAQLAEQKSQFAAQIELQRRQAEEQRRQFQLQYDSQQRQIEEQRRHTDAQAKSQQRQLDDQREQFRLQYGASQEETAAGRFSHAVEHLGSEVLETRLAAIHALSAVAKRSADDQWIVADVLTSFVRHRTPACIPQPWDEFKKELWKERWGRWDWPSPPRDVQLVVRFLATHDWALPPAPSIVGDSVAEYAHARRYHIDLSHADLRSAVFTQARLDGADLSGSCLDLASFSKASLRGASLRGAVARGASFASADLDHAELVEADLNSAIVEGANLRGANLRSADMQVDVLTSETFKGAVVDQHTRLTPQIREYLAREALTRTPKD